MKLTTSKSRSTSRKPETIQRQIEGGMSIEEVSDWVNQHWRTSPRKMVVIEMPDGKRYVSRSTNAGLYRGLSHSQVGTAFSCEIARHNKFESICEGDSQRFVLNGTEMWTNFRGFTNKINHTGDVYSVNGMCRDGETLIVRLGRLLVKARRPVDFALKEWKSKVDMTQAATSLRFVG